VAREPDSSASTTEEREAEGTAIKRTLIAALVAIPHQGHKRDVVSS